MRVFGSSGVRGVVNDDLTPEDATAVAQATGAVWTADGIDRAAVARDTRATGEMLVDAVASGLASVGIDVDRLGVVPTPGLQAYAERESVPGLMVTASHNPPEYNGIKLVGADGVELPRERLEAIETRLLDESVDRVPWGETGDSRRVDGAGRTYVDDLLAAVDREGIADADLTVALDPGHGAGSVTSPDFFRRLGCHVKTIHAQPDGHFPGRDPEPVADNLGDLRRFVRATDADLGVAHDGDADRAIFVDERGEFVEGDAALAALTAAAIDEGDTVVSAVNASQRLVDVAAAAGADLTLTPIGSTYIVSRIRDLQATGESVSVAGEGNGGILFPGFRIARDGAYTAARFCELLARSDGSASDVVARYDDYVNVRRDVEYDEDHQREAMLDAIERAARDSVADLDTTDGYRLDYGDGWVLARPSGTEPVVRIYAEARSADRAEDLADQLYDAVAGVRVD
ncbi:phosphoglucosamine mutase [Halosimplex salinum]|uniref:phosphoglucosamine mutase n=1 Tax=Halosimplex salinum TaxID=1710538 RepID=UPI000F466C29|nr:phosphoglucosamine mutase [Halosimplex salinum]